MRKAKLYQLLAVAGGLGAAVAATPVWAADSVTLTAGGAERANQNKPTDYTITFKGTSGGVWTYEVYRGEGRDLSHWSLGVGDCNVVSTTGSGAQTGNGGIETADAALAGLPLVKWNTDVSTDPANPTVFTFTLDGEYGTTDAVVVAKTGGDYKTDAGTITGPDCSTPVGDTGDTGGGNPNMACEDINGSNGVPMKLIAEYEANGNGGYSFVEDSGTDIINVASGSTPSVESGTVKIATFIEDGVQDSDGVVSGDSVQFCQVPVFDASEQVCLWSANKDADGNYINITQEGCTDAEQGKFYAIEAGGEFSSALEAE